LFRPGIIKLNSVFQNGLDFGIGIAQGEISVVKSGIPGEDITQDLIWLGWPTYLAYEFGNTAKSPYNIMISKNVYNALEEEGKLIYSGTNNMWTIGNSNFNSGDQSYFTTSYRITL